MKTFNFIFIFALISVSCGTTLPSKPDEPVSQFLSVGDYEIDIDDSSDVPIQINYGDMVTGKISYIPENMYLWLVVGPIESQRYYPQQSELIPLPPENEWALNVFVGTSDSGAGEQFKLLLVIVNAEGNQFFQDYLNDAEETGVYSGTDLPIGHEIINCITVVRAEYSDGPASRFLSVGDYEIALDDSPDNPIPINYGDMVTGKISYIPENMHLWLVVDPIESQWYYPQQSELIPLPPENEWALNVFVGTPDSGAGEQFNLLLVIVGEEGNQFFQDYLNNAEETGVYSGIDLSIDHETINSIAVVRAVE